MSGIVFFATTDRERVVEFYRKRLGFEQWVDQPDCTILARGSFRLGFCQRETADTDGIVTLLEPDRQGVDERYRALEDVAEGPPEGSEKYRIYHFFGTDPDGRAFEVQTFDHETPPV